MNRPRVTHYVRLTGPYWAAGFKVNRCIRAAGDGPMHSHGREIARMLPNGRWDRDVLFNDTMKVDPWPPRASDRIVGRGDPVRLDGEFLSKVFTHYQRDGRWIPRRYP